MNPNTEILQFKIRSAATDLFSKQGFDHVTMAQIAQALDIDEQELYRHYGSKFDIVLQLYQCINADWQIAVGNIETEKLHERFEAAMLLKLKLMDPYCDALAGMMGYLLRNDKVGVGSPRTAYIRQQGLATIRQVIEGATDAKRLKKKVESLPAALYLLHWTLLLLHVQGGDLQESAGSVAMAARMLKKAKDTSFLLPFFPFIKDLGQWATRFVGDTASDVHAVSAAILKQIFQHRKLIAPAHDCETGACKACINLHINKVEHFVAAGKPIHFVLPAFPAKSPNPQKTLGKLPDLGEEIALLTLQGLCDEIKAIYPPGAHVTICSDGRIFSELVEVSDADITAYVAHLRGMIAAAGIEQVEILNLEELLPGYDFDAARAHVLGVYAEPIEDLHARLKTSEAFVHLFNGIHRFIVEDRLVLHPELSASKNKELSKSIALQVIQHSNAWTRFLAQIYPEALRLSIHPYHPHSDKIGVQLTRATDNWLTPWHGVIVLGDDGYTLMKRKQALEMGAQPVARDGRDDHFTTLNK